MYARHGVAEYWIIDVESERILVHREPAADGSYATTHEFGLTETVSPAELPDLRLSLQSLFR